MKTKSTLLLVVISLLLTNTIYSQKKFPDPIRDTLAYGSYYPAYGEGFILEDVVFSTKVTLNQTKRNEYKWYSIIKIPTYNVVGYLYDDVEYEIEVLKFYAKKFGVPLANTSGLYFKGSLTYRGGIQNYSSLSGGHGSLGDREEFIYVGRENESDNFKISYAKIISVTKILDIKRLVEKMKKEGVSTEKYNSINKEVKTEAEKKAEAKKSLAKFNKDMINKQHELNMAKIKKESEANENNPYYNNRGNRMKREEERKKKEFKKSRRKLEKSVGDAFGAGLMGLVDGGGTLKFAYGIRSIEGNKPRRSPLDASTLEVGFGFGKIGIFGGYSLIHGYNDLSSKTTSGSGGTFVFGLDFTIYKFDLFNNGGEIGINGEYGSGKLEYKYKPSQGDIRITDYSSKFYSIGAQVRLFEFFYVSYNYGLYKTDETRSGGTVIPSDGKYTKLGFGLKYDFGY